VESEARQVVTPAVRTGMSRREAIGLGAAAVLGTGIAAFLPKFTRNEGGLRSPVFIGKAGGYEDDLSAVIMDGLKNVGFARERVKGKRVLLKPNLVETALGHSHINTHPMVIVAAAEAFRRMDAASIVVAEGQGHRRDSWLVLDESGMGKALAEAKLEFVDLNHDDVEPIRNAGRWSDLDKLFLPKTLLGADLIVSVPKLKTHHWAGVTCAMKNFFGVMPGVVYGWPKNVLHYAGIENSILDINATVRPHLAIVDGIVGMEGDGPIMGTPKTLGCIVVGANLPAVDATCTRLMGLQPFGVKYLAEASGRLGPVHERNIAQRGETIESLRSRFHLFDVPHLRSVAG